MCGIVGYSGKRSAQEVLLNGLEKLEYRGYDSAGVALALEGGIHVVKSKGRLEVLRRKLEAQPFGAVLVDWLLFQRIIQRLLRVRM